MKTKNNNTPVVVITSIICILPIILSLVVFNDLPEQIAVHWNNAGEPDVHFPKAIAAFGLPLIFFVINLYSKIRLLNDPKRTDTTNVLQFLSVWAIPFLSTVLVPVTLFISMGTNIPLTLITPVLVGVVLIVYGNYLPKSKQNYTIGIKLPWTLHNADNWNKTHRMAGYLYTRRYNSYGGNIFYLRQHTQYFINVYRSNFAYHYPGFLFLFN